MFEYIWVLLPIGLLIGWLAAKKDNLKREHFLQQLNLRYFIEGKGKSALETELDVPAKSEDEGLRFSLILGDAFRNRGEVDYAIGLHRYVMEQSRETDFLYTARYSLALDYLAAGILDRAEGEFRLLLESSHYKERALTQLAKIYEQQRDWLQAIAMLERKEEGEQMIKVAHLYCELAEEELRGVADYALLKEWLARALESNPDSIRAQMITIRVFVAQERYQEAFSLIKRVQEQGHPLTVILVPLFYRLAVILQKEEEFLPFLQQLSESGEPRIAIWQTHYLLLTDSLSAALRYLKSFLEESPNLAGAILYKELLLTQVKEDFHRDETLYLNILYSVIDQYAHYRCTKCGFATRVLQWQCPSCSEWDTSMPLSDIIALKNH